MILTLTIRKLPYSIADPLVCLWKTNHFQCQFSGLLLGSGVFACASCCKGFRQASGQTISFPHRSPELELVLSPCFN